MSKSENSLVLACCITFNSDDQMGNHIGRILKVDKLRWPTGSIMPKNIKTGISCYKLVSVSI